MKASGWLQSAVTKSDVPCAISHIFAYWTSLTHSFSSSSVVSRAFSALCMYSKFRHHPHPIGYLMQNFVSFAASVAKLAPKEKSRTQ